MLEYGYLVILLQIQMVMHLSIDTYCTRLDMKSRKVLVHTFTISTVISRIIGSRI